MNVKRISGKEIRRAAAPRGLEPMPRDLPPVLRASWKFARNMAKKFNRELLKERTEEMLKKLSKRFV